MKDNTSVEETKINLDSFIEEAIYNFLEGKGSEKARRSVAKSSLKSSDIVYLKKGMLEFGKKLLELAAENAELSVIGVDYKIRVTFDENMRKVSINKESILNTINQIEG